MLDLGTLGGSMSSALGINDNGQIVGLSTDADNIEFAFLMKSKGHAMENLGALGRDYSEAFAINNSTQVVGVAYDEGIGGFETAFLWEKGVMYDLNELTVDLPAGVSLVRARAINDRGWIVGRALVDGGINQHAFLLKPLRPNVAAALGLLILDNPPWLPQIDGQGSP